MSDGWLTKTVQAYMDSQGVWWGIGFQEPRRYDDLVARTILDGGQLFNVGAVPIVTETGIISVIIVTTFMVPLKSEVAKWFAGGD